MAAILKIQDGRHIYIWEIENIGFLIAYVTQFPKMYRFASLPKMPTKLHSHTAESKRHAKCNASRRQIVNFFRNISKYRLKKGPNVQFMSNKGVHGTIAHLTNLHTWNLHGKVLYISQTSENSFGTLPQNWTRFHSNVIFLNLFAYKSSTCDRLCYIKSVLHH